MVIRKIFDSIPAEEDYFYQNVKFAFDYIANKRL